MDENPQESFHGELDGAGQDDHQAQSQTYHGALFHTKLQQAEELSKSDSAVLPQGGIQPSDYQESVSLGYRTNSKSLIRLRAEFHRHQT